MGERFRKRAHMRLILLIALNTLSAALWAADKVQPLNIKTGLWEVTTTSTADRELPIPAGLLEKLTLEQRTRVEERMKAKPSDTQTGSTRKYCLTLEQLNKGATFGQDEKSCHCTIHTSSRNSLTMRMECTSQQRANKTPQILQIDVVGTEQVKGSVGPVSGGDQPQTSGSTLRSMFTAQWVAPTCGPTK
jgi:hypothetical protein